MNLKAKKLWTSIGLLILCLSVLCGDIRTKEC